MHLEFAVVGVPVSNQSGARPTLVLWRTSVKSEAVRGWTGLPLTGRLKAVVINFHTGEKPSLDLDNMSKPILDVLQGVVYADDRQVTQLELIHARIDAAFVFVGVSKLIVAAVQVGMDFVYVRIDGAIDPYPLPTR